VLFCWQFPAAERLVDWILKMAIDAPVAPVDQAVKDKFQKALSDARLTNSKSTITNRSPWQTKMATLQLLEYALTTRAAGESVDICILSGTATEGFYCANGVAGKLEECVKVGCSVRVLVWNDESHPAGTTLASLSRAYSNFKLALSKTREQGEEMPHFLVINGRAFRLEHSHKYLDGVEFTDTTPETKANICFNDIVIGSNLADFFNSMWEACVKA
jgi:hypothetical protein